MGTVSAVVGLSEELGVIPNKCKTCSKESIGKSASIINIAWQGGVDKVISSPGKTISFLSSGIGFPKLSNSLSAAFFI